MVFNNILNNCLLCWGGWYSSDKSINRSRKIISLAGIFKINSLPWFRGFWGNQAGPELHWKKKVPYET